MSGRFRGEFSQKVDGKGRMSIPADFRRVLERDIATVDLRLLDRITVRLRAAEATRLRDAMPQADIPTASTKPTPAKGKT